MASYDNPAQWILGILLILSSLGVILSKKPVHASLSFLGTLLLLATLYLQLGAQFIAVMQILVYAGSILVIFMFVMILFQDAHQKISETEGKSAPIFLMGAGSFFVISLLFVGYKLMGIRASSEHLPANFGTVESLGQALYLDFFFPFEAITLLFLVAVVGALYVVKKEL